MSKSLEDFQFKFGDKVELVPQGKHEEHYKGVTGIVVSREFDDDYEYYQVWFEGDYEAEGRYQYEIKSKEED